MFGSYFVPIHQATLSCAVLFLMTAFWAFWKRRNGLSLTLLTLAAFVLRLIAATLDPFLNQWDECFHALVSKRMLDDPFTPRLYLEGILPTSANWTQAGLWLHKPPFFLWQMAASLRVFGMEPWAVRIPSAIWLTALVPVIYRMGVIVSGHRVAWISAVFTTCSYYFLELTAGALTTDHNDAVFIAFVAFSWWALLEHWNDGRLRWAALAGLFSGCAILTKVFVGAVVFLPWFAAVLMSHNRRDWLPFFLGASLALGTSALWFGSLAIRFPNELAAQVEFDTSHLGKVVEGHEGSYDFHFDVIDRLMTPFTWWLVVPAYIYLVWHVNRKQHRLFLILVFVSIHGVFAFADTKMPSFTMVLFPLYILAISVSLVASVNKLIVARYRKLTILLTTGLLAGLFLNIEVLQHRHTLASPPKEHQQWRQQQMESIPVLAKLKDVIHGSEPCVVYHIPAIHHIQFMFVTGIEASDMMPIAADVVRLKAQGYTVYAVQDGEPIEHFPHGVIVISDNELQFPDVGRPN
ncbi:MAG: glycosyltransferase family 39 protein [Flavobacteriales bacterium]|nr:glycosyltransferase family 39 protein [Flavobacteriales bacterium]